MDSSSGAGSLIRLLFFFMLSLLCLQSTAEISSGHVFFIDSPTHQYLRSPPSDETNSMSVMEVGAAVSILLGLAPPPMLSTSSSSKLNAFLMPNPFDRPRHVFMLEVGLIEDSQAMVFPNGAVFSSAIKSQLTSSYRSIDIELPDREGVAFFSLDGPQVDLYEAAINDKKINDLATTFGGSYAFDNVEPLSGELIIPLPSGSKMHLRMSKKADRKFTAGLVYLIDNIKKVMEMKQDFPGSDSNVPELVGGYFDGIKALQEEYASSDVAQHGIELLCTTLSKVFDSLHARHKGEIVSVILFSKAQSSQSQKMLDWTFTSRPSPRWLEETKTPNATVIAELILVRRTLAWITGVLLLIATLIGVYLLLNMPLTRDTLLYSNVKLD